VVFGFIVTLLTGVNVTAAEDVQTPGTVGQDIPAAESASTQAENDDPASDPSDDSEPTIFVGKITVTATKREATAQEVPLSIEVLTGETLDQLVVEDIFDASRLVPNFTAGFSTVSNYITIRGIGSGRERSFEQAVAMFVDGVYMPRSRQWDQMFLDVARVEVMRGPQAVIHGLNATAGAVSVVTNRTLPGDPFFADLSAGYELEYGGPIVTAVVGGSPAETVGLRAAVKYLDTNGYFVNPTLGHNEGDTQNFSARVSAMWQPSEKVSVFAKIDHSDSQMMGNVGEAYGLDAEQIEPGDGVLNWRRSADGSMINPLGVFEHDDPGIVSDQTNASVEVDIAVGSGSLLLLGSWTDFNYDITTDVDTRALAIYDWEVLEDYEKAALEVRWASAADLPLAFMVGVYLHQTELVNDSNTVFGPDAAGPGEAVATYNLYELDDELISGFAQLTWRIDPTVRLVGGARYATDRKMVHRDSNCWLGILPDELVPMPPDGPTGLCPDPRLKGYNDERTSRNFMPEIALEWDISKDMLFYAKATTSAKAGGFASAGSFNPADSPEYGDEKAIGYELGLRSSFARGILSATAFLTDFKDLQVNAFVFDDSGVGTQIIGNAARARSQGLELQGRWAAYRSLQVGASLAWLDASYTSYPGAPCNSTNADPLGFCDQSGEKLPFAPDWSANLFADFRHDLGPRLALLAGLDIAGSDGYMTEGSLEPDAAQGSWVRVGARIGLAAPDDRWSVALIGRNLTKEAVIASSGTFGRYVVGYIDPPRTVTLMAGYRFR